MASLPPRHKWLLELPHVPPTSGREHRVIDWVHSWARRRSDIRMKTDSAGNILLTLGGRKRLDPVIATAHMDHPGFVLTAVDGRTAEADFMGGVMPSNSSMPGTNGTPGGSSTTIRGPVEPR